MKSVQLSEACKRLNNLGYDDYTYTATEVTEGYEITLYYGQLIFAVAIGESFDAAEGKMLKILHDLRKLYENHEFPYKN